MENITELQPSMKPRSGVKQEGYFLNADMRAKDHTFAPKSNAAASALAPDAPFRTLCYRQLNKTQSCSQY